MADLEMVPKHWPPRHNACTDPCDMICGPCACGAWHGYHEEWVQWGLTTYGRTESVTQRAEAVADRLYANRCFGMRGRDTKRKQEAWRAAVDLMIVALELEYNRGYCDGVAASNRAPATDEARRGGDPEAPPDAQSDESPAVAQRLRGEGGDESNV